MGGFTISAQSRLITRWVCKAHRSLARALAVAAKTLLVWFIASSVKVFSLGSVNATFIMAKLIAYLMTSVPMRNTIMLTPRHFSIYLNPPCLCVPKDIAMLPPLVAHDESLAAARANRHACDEHTDCRPRCNPAARSQVRRRHCRGLPPFPPS